MLRVDTSTPRTAEAASVAEAATGGTPADRARRAFLEVADLAPSSRETVQTGDDLLATQLAARIEAGLQAIQPAESAPLSDDLRTILLQAWRLAEALRSASVTPLHLTAAMIGASPRWAEAIGKVSKADPAWLLSGALIRPAALDMAAGPQPHEKIAPSLPLLEWIAEAAAHAVRKGTAESGLRPGHLIAVLSDPEAKQPVRHKLKRTLVQTARVGRTPSELVKARQGVESTRMTLGFFRSDATAKLGELSGKVRRIEKILTTVEGDVRNLPAKADLQSGLASVATELASRPSAPSTDLTPVAERLAALEQQLSAMRPPFARAEPPYTRKEFEDFGDSMRASLRQFGVAQDRKLLDIESHARALAERLPTPPSTVAVALALVAVLALGIGTGVLLAAH